MVNNNLSKSHKPGTDMEVLISAIVLCTEIGNEVLSEATVTARKL